MPSMIQTTGQVLIPLRSNDTIISNAKEYEMSNRHWHSSYGNIPAEINPDAYPSVVAMLEAAMVTFADQSAFKCFGQTVSYADVDHQSRAFAAYLQNKLGIQPSNHLAT